MKKKSTSTNATISLVDRPCDWWSPLTFEQYKASNFFPALDGVRAVAVVLVISQHYGGTEAALLSGWLGVHIFFVMSGFLITTLLVRENDQRGRVDLRAFYVRRVFRIMPAYYVVLLLMAWQVWSTGGPEWDKMKVALPYYLTFFNELPYTGWAPWKLTWTMGIEWKFYLVWPLLAFVAARTRRARAGVLILVALYMAALWNTKEPLFPCIYSILFMGAVLALSINSRAGFSFVSIMTRPAVSAGALALFIALQFSVGRLLPLLGDKNLSNLYGLAVVAFIPAILGRGLPRFLLSTAPLTFVGKRSFSLYLVQELAWHAVTRWTPWPVAPGWSAMAAVLAVGLLIAELVYRFVERPMISAGRSIERGLAR
jgi:peptidoglycan/LPS O-acetylase OafA/YrhL